jgi:hypothetical protein
MGHCVATYAEQVFACRSWLYFVSRQGERLAPLELRKIRNRFARVQIKDHCNRAQSRAAAASASSFVARINAAVEHQSDRQGERNS